ncbi:MFS transporter [Nocardia harenae]|uniref:MFS transporter n=1 Tax=Nocardia harenae TaxID=358707 RepID=UPI000834A2EE|nr:MFS transporter [Nocardia harenae]
MTGRGVLIPLALAQFLCSFAGSNMTVMISDISADLDTTVHGVQVTITLFLLVMAALMIPGGVLADRFGRRRCFTAGLAIYGLGAALSAFAPTLGILMLGNSILEGIGTALLIPPIYILTSLLCTGTAERATAFGAIMAAGGVGAAAGPLIGGVITTAVSWRASFAFQTVVVVLILVSSRRIRDPLPPDPARRIDVRGALLSASGLVLMVAGILAAATNLLVTLGLVVLGILLLAGFAVSARADERAGRRPLLSLGLFRNRVSDLGLLTQNLQWLLLMGISFVVAAYLQVEHGYSAIGTGVVFTAATAGLLVSSLAAGRLVRRHPRRTLVQAGFALTAAGIALLLLPGAAAVSAWALAPGLGLAGLGLGVMLTPSVDLVQSAFDERRQGEISGLSRCVSNLGSALGTAVAGTVLVLNPGGRGYGAAMVLLGVLALGGLAAAALLPREPVTPRG